MRLVCKTCGTRSRIADELVQGRRVKVRCRNCSALIEVSSTQHPSPSPPPRRRPHRITIPPPLPSRADRAEWYLGVGDSPVGPMSLEELRLRVQRREAGADDLVWREGFGGWEPIAQVAEVQVALSVPPLEHHTTPPPLPTRRQAAVSPAPAGVVPLRVIPGGQAAAVAPALQPAPQPMAQPVPTAPPAPQPVPQPLPRWPILMLAASGFVLVAAVIVVMVGRGRTAEPVPPAPAITPRVRDIPPAAHVEPVPEPQPVVMPDAATPPPIEIHVRRGPRPGASVTPAKTPDAGTPDTVDRDFNVVMASRILRRNRSALAACDRLAERRGENLEGARALFTVRVSDAGRVETSVRGDGITAALLSCYSAVSSQWQVPTTGKAFTVTFRYVH